MSDSHRRETAIHEAGHAVMALRLEVTLGVVTLKPKDKALAGMVSSEADWRMSAPDARVSVAVKLAGWAALAALGSPNAELGCESDFQTTRQALAAWKLGDIERWRAKVLRVMRRPRNVRAVAALADSLLAGGQLDDEQADFVVMLSDGEITKAQFERRQAHRGWRSSG